MAHRRRRPRERTLRESSSYSCDWCHENVEIPIDWSAGGEQEMIEDCPICCRPNVIHVELDEDGALRVWAARE
jgi:hypothetical protein